MISAGRNLRFGWLDATTWTENSYDQVYNEDSLNRFYSGFFDSNFKGFWVGSAKKLTYPTSGSEWVFSMPVGAIMTVQSSNSALPISDTYGLASSFINDNSVTY